MKRIYFTISILSICLLCTPSAAHAYAGLGSMVPIIGNGILLLFVFGATLLGLVAYPLKMMLAKLKASKNTSSK